MRPLLYVCAPWRERTAESLAETRAAISTALALGWAPIFAPLLLPDLDDADLRQRETAFSFDFAILARCQGVLVVGERVTEGMRWELDEWGEKRGRPWTVATLPETSIGSADGR